MVTNLLSRIERIHMALLVVVAGLIFSVVPSAAQDFGDEPGMPTFSSLDSFPLGNVNIANLNLHIELPIASFEQPGGRTLTYKLTYDSKVWKAVNNGLITAWLPTNLPANSIGGWRFVTSADTGSVTFNSFSCDQNPNDVNPPLTTYNQFEWTDPIGNKHQFSIQTGFLVPSCGVGPSTGDGFADDGSGYHMFVTNYTQAAVYAKDGTRVYPAYRDANGNTYTSDADGNIIDALGRTPVLVSKSGDSTFYDILSQNGPQGPRNRVTVTTETLNITTNFQFKNISECQNCQITVIKSISYPDGSVYQFDYGTPHGGVINTCQVFTGSFFGSGLCTFPGLLSFIGLPTGGGLATNYSAIGDNVSTAIVLFGGWIEVDSAGHGDPNSGAQYALHPEVCTPGDAIQFANCVVQQNGNTRLVPCPFPCEMISAKHQQQETDHYVFQIAGQGAWLIEHDSPVSVAKVQYSSSDTGCVDVGPCFFEQTFQQYQFNGGSRSFFYTYDDPKTQNVTRIQEQVFERFSTTEREIDLSYFPASQFTGSPNIVNRVSAKQAKPLSSSAPTFKCDTGSISCSAFQYDGNGNLTQNSQWLDKTGKWLSTNLAYDSLGNLTSSIDPANHTTAFAYDSSNVYLKQITLPHTGNGADHVVSVTYEPDAGLLTKMTDQNGKVETYGYDATGRISSIGHADGGSRSAQYISPNLVEIDQVMDARTLIEQSLLDGIGRVTSRGVLTGVNTWARQDTCYDSRDRVAFISLPYVFTGSSLDKAGPVCPASGSAGTGENYTYDVVGRVVSVVHADGAKAKYGYDGGSISIVEESNGSGNRKRLLHRDSVGRLVAVCEVTGPRTVTLPPGTPTCGDQFFFDAGNLDVPQSSPGIVTTYGYDLQDNLTSANQPGVLARTWQFDSLGRLTQMSSPEAGGATYQYNDDGLLTSETRPAPNNETTPASTVDTLYAYDELHRLLSRQYRFTGTQTPEPNTPDAYFSYDLPASVPEAWSSTPQNNLIGRLAEEWTGTPTTAITAQVFGYDPMGRVIRNDVCTPRTCGTSSYPFSYSYDSVGHVLTHTNGVGTQFKSLFNDAGQLLMKSSSLADADHPGTLISNISYNPFGVASATLGNGIGQSFTYDSAGRWQGETDQGDAISFGTALVSFAGTEQSVQGVTQINQPAASVMISGKEQQTQKQVPATTASATVTISGFWDQGTCCAGDGGTLFDTGNISVLINGTQGVQVLYQNGDTFATIAQHIVSAFGGSPFNASYTTNLGLGTATVTVTTTATGLSANYPFSCSSISSYPTSFNPPSFTVTCDVSMHGGENQRLVTVNDSGQANITVNGHANSYNWGTTDTPITIAQGLAAAINGDASAPVTATTAGTVVTVTSKQPGTNYPISSGTGCDTADFTSCSFSFANSASSVSGQVFATIYDGGTANITVNGHSDSYTWGQGDTPLTIAQNLAANIDNDPNAFADAKVVAGGVISLTAKKANTDYSLAATIQQNPNPNFPSASFTTSASSSGLQANIATGAITISGSEGQTPVQNALPAAGSVSLAGNERTIVAGGAPGKGSVTISGNLLSTQVQTQAGTPASVVVTIGGADSTNITTICIPGSLGRQTCHNVNTKDAGTISITVSVGSTIIGPVSTPYNGNSTPATLASGLFNNFPGNSVVTMSNPGGSSSFTLTTTATGAGSNSASITTSVASSCNPDNTDCAGPGWTMTPASANFSGGQNPVFATVYDSGTTTVTVNGTPFSCSWSGSATTPASIAACLAGQVTGSVNATASNNVVNLTATSTGVNTDYTLTSSSGYDASHFSSASFSTSNSGATLTGGLDSGTTYDTGTVSVAVNGHTNTVPYAQNSTITTLAASLADAINGDSNASVRATASAGTISVIAKSGGSITNTYNLTVASASNSSAFTGTSFQGSTSGSTLSGGADPVFSFDTGTVSATINGVTDTVTYGKGSTSASIASALSGAINGDPNSSVTAFANGAAVSLASNTSGSTGDFAMSATSTSTNSLFGSPSFMPTPSGANLTGGKGAGGTVYSFTIANPSNNQTGFAGNGSVLFANDSVNGSWSYAYDLFNRLASATGSQNNTPVGLAWVYDTPGNRLQQNVTAGTAGSAQYTVSGKNNHLDGFTYDQMGNQLSDGLGRQFTYDAEGRLVAVNGVTLYVYDAEGQRVSGPQFEYLRDLDGRAVTLLDKNTGSWVRGEVFAGPTHLATYANGSTYFVHTDYLDSERARSDVNGSRCFQLTTLPFGDGQSRTGTCDVSALGFGAREHDPDSLTEHTLFRQYSSLEGRWLTPDPSGGNPDLTDPQTWNRYAYLVGNPVSNIDRLGLDDCDPEADDCGDPDDPPFGDCGSLCAPPDGIGFGTFEIDIFTKPIIIAPTFWDELGDILDTVTTDIFFRPYSGFVNMVVNGKPSGAWEYVSGEIMIGVPGAEEANGAIEIYRVARGVRTVEELSQAGRITEELVQAERFVQAGDAGRFADLQKLTSQARKQGQALVPHHMPQAALQFTERAEGGALVMEDAEHALTRTFRGRGKATKAADAGLPFRKVLVKDIKDVRKITGRKYNKGMLDLLEYYKTNHPELMRR